MLLVKFNLGYSNILRFLGWFSISVPFNLLSPCPNYSWIRVTRQRKLRIRQHWKILTWIEFWPITYILPSLCKAYSFHPFPTIISSHSTVFPFCLFTQFRSPDGSCVLTNSDDNVLRIFNLPVELYNGTAAHGLSEMVCIVWFTPKVVYVTMACLCTTLSNCHVQCFMKLLPTCAKWNLMAITPNYSVDCSW